LRSYPISPRLRSRRQSKLFVNVVDSLCDTLLANGVDVCFANTGTSEMHFVAVLDRKPQMRCVLALFEGLVTGAADGFARMVGKPATTLLHLGPGPGLGLARHARRQLESIPTQADCGCAVISDYEDRT
jgi:thiamine pyrophosphate-dependent acetolactate synthase large subunit-like protein